MESCVVAHILVLHLPSLPACQQQLNRTDSISTVWIILFLAVLISHAFSPKITTKSLLIRRSLTITPIISGVTFSISANVTLQLAGASSDS